MTGNMSNFGFQPFQGQSGSDGVGFNLTSSGNFDIIGLKLRNVGLGTAPSDAHTKSQSDINDTINIANTNEALLTTKGDIYVFATGGPVEEPVERFPAGGDDSLIVYDSSTGTGLKTSRDLNLLSTTIGDADFKLSLVSGDPQIDFNGGDFIKFDRTGNQFEFKISSAPNPDMVIQNGLVQIRNKLEIADEDTFIDKLTTGPNSGDVTIRFGDTGISDFTDLLFDFSDVSLTFIIANNNRLKINSLGLNLDPTDSNQTPISYNEDTELFAAFDYTDSGGVDNFQEAAADVTGLVEFVRKDNIVSMLLQGVQGTMTLGSTIDAVAGAVPVRFRVLVEQSFSITITELGPTTFKNGVIRLNTDGSFNIGRNGLANFQTGDPVGFGTKTINWNIRDFSA